MIAPVLSADDLLGLLTGPRPVVVADVRWYLDGRDGRAAHDACHLPGAIWIDLEAHLTRHDLPPTAGRHPLPDPAAFATSMGSLGIGDDTVVVAYDDTGGLTAGRLAVMLRMLGRDAALLDGGLPVWQADGRPTASGPTAPLPATTFTAAPWPAERVATVDDVTGRGACLIDARAAERFTGEVTMIDPRPGHIPGARNAPWNGVLAADGRFRSRPELLAHYAALGASDGDTIAYCGSGISACMNVIAMEHAGLTPPRLFVASFSGWAADPTRTVETGA